MTKALLLSILSLIPFQFSDPHQGLSVFCQTALALAAAEREYKMEHRDLHTGNILVFTKDEEKKQR